ncbi:MAG TPA: hypothetical protein VII23_25205 [Terriglobales bacterium]
MKVIVNRQLSGGLYYVSFKVGDWTPEELSQMQSFGVPNIPLRMGPPLAATVMTIPMTRITDKYQAGFKSEPEAKAYEESTLGLLRVAVASLREKTDKFTSTAEVDI